MRLLPIKERRSFLFVGAAQVDVRDGSFVVSRTDGIRTAIPLGALACVVLEPGTRVSHAAVVLAARVGVVLLWMGEGATRLYSAGHPGGASAEKILRQAACALDPARRLRVARAFYVRRFGVQPPPCRTVEQLRGFEGIRVREAYQRLALAHGIEWGGRETERREWSHQDLPNRCLSVANACLYGLVEAAVLVAGYSPAIGFVHWNRPLAFVYDIADLYKLETVVPAAFSVAASSPAQPERAVRRACRELFKDSRLLRGMLRDIESVLDHGGGSS